MKRLIGVTTTCLMVQLAICHADLTVSETPSTIIREGDSELDRPEGVTFSPDGKYIATANSLIDTVTFYKRVGEEGAIYEVLPSFSIGGEESLLNYPHDVAFSPDGRHLAVACRRGNAITIYEKDGVEDFYHNVPIAVIKGLGSGVVKPDSVRYSPIENVLAVANLGTNTITFYHYDENGYKTKPYQTIEGRDIGMIIPDSLDFTLDGELLAVTSHDAASVLIFKRVPNTRGKYSSKPVQIIKGPGTHLTCPHSVSFHPSKEFLIVTSAQGLQNVNIFKKSTDGISLYDPEPIVTLDVIEMYEESTLHLLDELQEEGGCKGVSFAPDGKAFAVTQNLCADDLKLPYSVGVLLVYPVEIQD